MSVLVRDGDKFFVQLGVDRGADFFKLVLLPWGYSHQSTLWFVLATFVKINLDLLISNAEVNWLKGESQQVTKFMEKIFHFDSPPEPYVADAAVLCCFDQRIRLAVHKFLQRRGLCVRT